MTRADSAEQPLYSERVIPGIGLFIASFSLLPAIALVAEPFNLSIGVVLGSVAVGASWFSFIYWAPKIVVTATELRVGIAHIPRKLLGDVSIVEKDTIFQERGPNLDPMAFTSFQSSVKTAVKIRLADSRDPTPYWLISTRRPNELARVLADKG